MPNLTPTDVRNAAFNKPPLGRRGYDEDEVDAFLNRVEDTLTALYDEIARLRAIAAAPAIPSPALPSPATPHSPYAALPAATSTGPPALTAVLAELDMIKQRLARVEQALAYSTGFSPT